MRIELLHSQLYVSNISIKLIDEASVINRFHCFVTVRMPPKQEYDATLNYFNRIPLEIVSVILFFFINDEKYRALLAWDVCKEWRGVVNSMLGRIFKTSIFDKYRIRLPYLMNFGISAWDTSLFNFVLGIQKFFLGKKDPSPLFITMKIPNIIILYGSTRFQSFIIKIKHDCTIWSRHVTMRLFDINYNIDDDIIICEQYERLHIVSRNGNTRDFGRELTYSEPTAYLKNNYGSTHLIHNVVDVILKQNDIIKLLKFIENADRAISLAVLRIGPNSFAILHNKNKFENTNSSRIFSRYMNTNITDISDWLFYIKQCRNTCSIWIRYQEHINALCLKMKCDTHTATIRIFDING